MKKIELYLNILHYCFYRFDYKLHLLSNKINPILLLYKLPFFKKTFQEKGIADIGKDINIAFSNKEYGLSMLVAGGGLMAVLFFIFITAINLWYRLFINGKLLTKEDFIVSCIISAIISYFTVFKKDKYLIYFNEFEKWNRKIKQRNYIFSLLILILAPTIFILSFVL